jgi:hypothetical protein
MPAASSFARFGGNASGGADLETIEMDPLFAEVVGLRRGDVVSSGLQPNPKISTRHVRSRSDSYTTCQKLQLFMPNRWTRTTGISSSVVHLSDFVAWC